MRYTAAPHRNFSWRNIAGLSGVVLAFGIVSSPVVLAKQTSQRAPENTAAVQTILTANCYGCHTDRMKGGLRADSLQALIHGGESGAAIVPGRPEDSLLSKAISYKDADLKMPPRAKLADADIAVIDAWIKAGAPDIFPAAAVATIGVPGEAHAALPPSAQSAQEQYFETKVRPLLVSKCYGCHTAAASGGLRLDSRAFILQGGKDGQVVDLAHPEDSMVLKAVHYKGLQMPPKKQLDDAQVATLEQWVRDGLVWPAEAPVAFTAVVTDKDRQFWSYEKPVAPAVPTVPGKWARNDIDRFVLAKLDDMRLIPVKDADRRTMIRRVTYDLTGLPPTPAEVTVYLNDKSPEAYPKLVDRLLASKAYAERWGRIWLDVVRYSDTTGEGADYPIPEVYKYRDYVVQSFADDVPYDRFIQEQIAGDLLPYKTEPEHWKNIIATGYVANANRYEDYVSDTVDNIGYAYLGTSIACARCHDHKFDPIPTADYYGIYGIFASTQYASSGAEEVRYEHNMVYRDPAVLKSQKYIDFQAQLRPIANTIHAANQLPYFDDILPALQERRIALFKNEPKFEDAYAVTEGTPHDEHIQHLGEKKNQGDEVPRHFLQVAGNWQLPATKQSGRLELANWIASPDNPLTARVMVNRIWQGHFGRGIVATPNDFGKRGAAPSNQALLDYLATDFIAKGWSVKAMHREILLSHTYQLSSDDNAPDELADSDDQYLWRHSRLRMDAEEIRDSMLATSGTLDSTPAGEQPFPASWQWNYSSHVPFHAVYETNRRTLYVMTQRSRHHPYLGLFDGPDTAVSVGLRDSSVTPLQSLYFMNADFPKNCAAALTKQLETGNLSTREEINRAFMIVYDRVAGKDEIDHAEAFITSVAAIYKAHGNSSQPVLPPSPLRKTAYESGTSSTTGGATLTDKEAHEKALGNFIQALYASNEFMFID